MIKQFLFAALVALIALPAYAQDTVPSEAAPKTNAERIIPEGWENTYNRFHYAPAVRAGDTLYLSGIVATLQGEENENNPEDLEAAFDRCFDALEKVLKEAGADFSHVVEMTTFHTELIHQLGPCLLYTSPSPRDQRGSRMPSSA